MKLQEAEQSQSRTKDLNWMAKKMQRKMIRTQLLATSFLAKKHHRCLSTRILVETRIWPLAPSENIGSTVCEHCKLGRISWKQRISHSFFYESPYLSHTSSLWALPSTSQDFNLALVHQLGGNALSIRMVLAAAVEVARQQRQLHRAHRQPEGTPTGEEVLLATYCQRRACRI